MIREALADLARNESVGGLLARTPVARDVVARVVAGEGAGDAIEAAARLADDGFWTALEYSGSRETMEQEYLDLVGAVETAGLTESTEIVILAEGFAEHDVPSVAAIAARAAERGVATYLGFGPTIDPARNLELAQSLWSQGLGIGLTLPAAWRRTEVECARLGDRRVRLVKGSTGLPGPAHRQPIEIDKAFVRCARRLVNGTGSVSFATHDPRIIGIVEDLVSRSGRAQSDYEYTFFMGRQVGEQHRLAAAGERVRVYVPYGPNWFERLVGGLAEQPSTLASAVRSLLPWP